MQKTTSSGSKPLHASATETKKVEVLLTSNLSDLESQMKSLSGIVVDFKKSYEAADDKSVGQADSLVKAALTLKNLIATFGHLAHTIGNKSRGEEEEGLESQASNLIESVKDLNYNFRAMEDRFMSLSKEAADVPASSTPQTEA
jgi:hypothetical protein